MTPDDQAFSPTPLSRPLPTSNVAVPRGVTHHSALPPKVAAASRLLSALAVTAGSTDAAMNAAAEKKLGPRSTAWLGAAAAAAAAASAAAASASASATAEASSCRSDSLICALRACCTRCCCIRAWLTTLSSSGGRASSLPNRSRSSAPTHASSCLTRLMASTSLLRFSSWTDRLAISLSGSPSSSPSWCAR